MQTRELGAIFDWDGVIVDSQDLHNESWERLAAEENCELPADHFHKGFGMKNEFIVPNILGWTKDPGEIRRLSLRKEELYREIVGERSIWPLPGVSELLAALREAGVPRVIGSSTHRLNITATLEQLGLAGMFDGIVSAEDVSHGKPDPEVFLKCAECIERPPGKCVVFEDAHVGIEAARHAGMQVIAVATTNPLETLGNASLAVQSLAEVGVQTLVSLVGTPALAQL